MKFYQEYKNAFRILSKGRVVLDVFSKGIKSTALLSAVAASALMGDAAPNALPANPNIVQGNINIQTTTNNMVINQSTDQGIINWGTFNIGSAASVRFNQPNASASTLNRVVGNEVSNIAGSLSATGKVILINPNGVIFQNGSRVDVGGIVASTMNLSNENYLNNTLRFTRDGSGGSITNRGTIRAGDAGYVALLAPEVINEGVVIAQKGSAIFASGDAVTLSADSAGLLSVTVDAATVNTLIENRGLVEADGGVVYMSAKAASDAYAATISNTGTIQANSLEERDGKIILFAHNGTTNVDGTLTAKGGFIETSGENVHIADTVKVNTTTDDKSKVGTWLIDPTNFTVSAGSAAQTTSGIGVDTLQTNLAGGNIAITTSATANGSDLGDIIIDAPLSWSANTLSLSAHHSVLVNSVVSVSGTAGLTVTTNTGGYTDDIGSGITNGTRAGYLKFKQNRTANSAGTTGTDIFDGKVNWTSSGALNINGSNYTIISAVSGTSGTDLNELGGQNGKYALAGDLTASGAWTPIGGFAGTLEGLGHTISNISVTAADTTSPTGFISYVISGAVLQNIGLLNAQIVGKSDVGTGGFIGQTFLNTTSETVTLRNLFVGAGSTITNGDTSSHSQFGGFIGYNMRSSSNGSGAGTVTIVDGYNGASIYGSTNGVSSAGGIVGQSWDSVTGNNQYLKLMDLYNIGEISGGTQANKTQGNYAAGIIGFIGTNNASWVKLENLRNYGAINTNSYGGGIMGSLQGSSSAASTLHNLSNYGTITSSGGYIGGIACFVSQYGANGGGTTTLSYLTNKGTVTSTGNSVGGILASINGGDNANFVLSNLMNEGAVTGSNQLVGGVIGAMSYGYGSDTNTPLIISLSDAYNSGTVTATGTTFYGIGGIVGRVVRAKLTISDVYNRGTISAPNATACNGTECINVGGLVGYFQIANSSGSTFSGTALSLTDSYSISGLVGHDNIVGGFVNGSTTTNNITSANIASITGLSLSNTLAGNGLVTDADFKAATLAQLGFSSSVWSGGSGSYARLLGRTIPITITVAALSKTYGDNNPTVTYTESGSSYISNITWGSAIGQYTGVGTYAYTATNMFTPSYASGSASDYDISYATTNSFTISPKAVTLGGTMVYQGSATTLGASLNVTNTLNGDVVTVTNGGSAAISGKNVGTQTIDSFTSLSLNNANYTLTGASGSLSVTARPVTVSVSNVAKTYDGTTSANATLTSNTVTQTTGLVPGDTMSGGTFAFTDKNAGTANKTVTVSGVTISDGNGGNNYAVTYANNTTSTINKATLTVTGTKTYDGTTTLSSGILTLGGFIGSETVGYGAATASSSHVATSNKYVSSITLSDGANGGLAANYQIPAGYGAGTNALTISAKTLTPTISNTGVTKVYDGDTTTAMTPTYTFSGLVGGDTGATLNNTAKAYNSKDVANATRVTLSGLSIAGITGSNGSAVTDYVLDSASKTVAATITPKTVSLSSVNIADKVYDGTTAATSVVSSTFTGTVSGDDVNVNGTLGTFANKNVGTYSVSLTGLTLTGAQAGNYILSGTTATDNSVAITPKTVTLSASKVYDGTTNLGGAVTLGGFVGSETLTYSGATANSAHNVAGNYIGALTLADGTGGGVATNYALPTLNNANAPVTITPVTLTAALSNTGITKTYDGGTTTGITPTYTVTGFIANDSAATIAHTAKAYNSKDVLTADSVTVSGLSLSGITGSNGSIAADYVLASNSLSAAATVTPKSLTVSGLVADNKVYDGTATATLSNWGSVTTGVASETLTLNHGTATFSDKNKANAKTLTATGYNLADGANGGVASNYVLSSTSATTTANITARAVTLSGSTGVSKTYDGLTAMPVGSDGYGSVGNGVTGDDLYVSGAPVFNSAGAGSKTVLIGSVALAGADASNYALNWSNGSGTINKATLSVTANNDAKFVTQNDTANFTGVSYSGFVNGEGTGAITTTGLSVARNNAGVNNAGHYSGVLAASGLSAANYDFNYVNGDYTIVPADQLLVRVSNTASTYGTAATYTITSAEYLNGSNQIASLNLTGVNPGTNFTLSDGVGGTATFTLGATNQSLSGANLLKAGSYQVGATNVTESSANFSNTLTVVGALTVNQKAVTVGASNVSKAYDGTTSMNNLSLGLSGVESGDALTISGNGTFAGKNAGTNKAYSVSSLTLGSTDSANYYLSGGNAMSGNDGVITKKTVTLGATKTYDGTTDLTGKVTVDTGVTVDGLSETLTYGGATANSATVPNNAANYINAITLADGTNGGIVSNYQLPTLNHTNAAVTINKKDLSVVANSADKIVGAEDPVFTYSANGFVNNETVSVLRGALSRVSGTAPGDYVITLGTLDADNYNLLLNGAQFTIKSTFIPPVPPTIPTPSVPAGGTGLGSGTGTGDGGTGTTTGTGTSGHNGVSETDEGGSGGSGSTGSTGPGTAEGSGTNGGGTSAEGENGTGGGTSWWQSLFGGGETPTNSSGNSGGTGSGDGGRGTGPSTGTGATGTNSGTAASGSNSGSQEGASTASNGSEASKGENEGLNNFSNKPQGTETASFGGISVGTTQSGKEVKAIIIQGASASSIPVTMLVSVKTGEGFSFSLPSATLHQVAQSMASHTSQSKPRIAGVSLSDGRALPSWLSFDIDTMRFSSANVPVGGLPLTVKVVVANNGMTKIIEVVLKNGGEI